jgi:hypothetical protein
MKAIQPAAAAAMAAIGSAYRISGSAAKKKLIKRRHLGIGSGGGSGASSKLAMKISRLCNARKRLENGWLGCVSAWHRRHLAAEISSQMAKKRNGEEAEN